MVSVSDYMEIADAATFPEKLVLMNEMTGYTLTGSLMVIIAFVLYGIMRYSNVENTSAIAASCFAAFMVSSMGWAIKYNAVPLVHGSFPILFLLVAAIAVAIKVLNR
jgi:hypothetical protein